jgi:putative tryptophan/tyrosine transport system substrate-binding protein
MRRRQFIAVLGGAAIAPAGGLLGARAQQAGKLPIIGFLGVDSLAFASWKTAFAERLRALGWIDGRTVAIEYRWSEGRPDRVAEITTEFVKLPVDVIVTFGDAVPTLKQATSTIPIVFAIGKDPLGNGFVASLARPGGNVTGLSTQANDTTSKRLELLGEVVPRLHRLAIMGNVGFSDSSLEMDEVKTAARKLGLEVVPLEIRQIDDIATAFAASNARADALDVVTDALIGDNRADVIALALGARLPTIFNNRIYPQSGGLMSFGPNFDDLFRRAADYVDKILRGAKPDDLPVEQPTKFELVVNLKTAKALGLTIPETFLTLADEVIE